MQTGFRLPVRVDVATGERLEPTGIDPYSLLWVQGAASTVPTRVKRFYTEQLADLREKLAVLRSKRAAIDTDIPAFGPRRRPAKFRMYDQQPPGADGDPGIGGASA